VIDIDLIDLFDFRNSYRPTDRILLYLLREFISFLRIENLLRVVKAAKFVVLGKDDGAGDDRSREWRHAGFVAAGDEPVTLRPKFDFEAQQEVQSLTFGAIVSVTAADASRELVSALALINFESFK